MKGLRDIGYLVVGGIVLAGLGIVVTFGFAVYPAMVEFGWGFLEFARQIGHLLLWLVGGGIALVIVGGIVSITTRYKDAQTERLRQRDGSYALVQHTRWIAVGAWWEVWRWERRTITVNPNKMIGPAMATMGDGSVLDMVAPHLVPAYMEIAAQRNRVSLAQAAMPGDRAIEHMDHYRPSLAGMRTALRADPWAQPHQQVTVEQPPQIAAAIPEADAAMTRAALRQVTQAQLPLGVDQSDGQIVMWDAEADPHLRLHSKTRNGKSYLMRLLATEALAAGAEVELWDRRYFKDFRFLENSAHFVDTRDPKLVVEDAERLVQTYRERDALLGRAGVGSVRDLGRNAPARRVVFISEFGALIQSAAAEGCKAELLRALQLVAREGGAGWVSLIAEDQVALKEVWPSAFASNCVPVTGQLPANYASAGGYYEAHNLKPFEFHYRGQIFRPLEASDATLKPVIEGVVTRRGPARPFAPAAQPVQQPAHFPSAPSAPAHFPSAPSAPANGASAPSAPASTTGTNAAHQAHQAHHRGEGTPENTPLPTPSALVRQRPRAELVEWYIEQWQKVRGSRPRKIDVARYMESCGEGSVDRIKSYVGEIYDRYFDGQERGNA